MIQPSWLSRLDDILDTYDISSVWKLLGQVGAIFVFFGFVGVLM